MKKSITVAGGVLALIVSSVACAGWQTTTKDDIFSGGKSASMLGEVSSSQAIIFDCAADSLQLALVEKGKVGEGASELWSMLAKVDGGKIHRFETLQSQRNDKFIEFGTGETEEILSLLKDLRNAKSTLLLGLQAKNGGKWSGSANVNGSTKAVNDFVQACNLKLE